jgi:PKD domain
MRLPWFSGPTRGHRRAARRRRNTTAALRVRLLERRRVLDAGLTSLVVNTVVVADAGEASTGETSQQPLVFDWTTHENASGNGDGGQDATMGANDAAQAGQLPPSDAAFSHVPNSLALETLAAGQASAAMANGAINIRPVLIQPLNQAVDEGHSLDLSGLGGAPPLGLFVDPDAGDTHTATVNWGDNSPTEMAAIFSAPGAGALGGTHTYDDNGTYTVTLHVSDGNGGSDTRTFEVLVSNVAPMATLANDGPVEEGSAATVQFVGQNDPSGADTAAGFRYAYDFDNDGTFDVGDGTYAGSVTSDSQLVPASFFAQGPGLHEVSARIIDKDDGHRDVNTQIPVTNAAPELAAISGDSIEEDQVATIGMTIVDPGASDVFSVEVNWMDGTSDTISGLGSVNTSGAEGGTSYTWNAAMRRLELSHQYLDDGPNPGGGLSTHLYSVELVVSDGEDTSAPYTAEVIVDNVRPVLVVPLPQTLDEGQTLNLSGLGGAPPVGLFVDDGTLDVHTATINWGDGSPTENADVFEVLGSGALGGSHFYADDGVYLVTVRVTDDDGDFDQKSFTVVVENVPPTLDLSGPTSVDEGASNTWMLGPVIDPGSDTVSQYIVDWGDGNTDTFSAAQIAAMSGMISHTYADGLSSPTITVDLVDEEGAYESVASLAVTVNNVPPMVDLTGPTSVDEGAPNTWTLGPIVDPGSDTVSQYIVHWGDGDSDTFTAAQIASMGRTVEHAYADGPASHTITVDLVDEDGTYLTVDLLIVTVKNVPPALDLSGPTSVDEGAPNTWTLGPIVDPGSDTVSQYVVHWGDGDSDTFTAAQIASMGRMIDHTYADGLSHHTISVDLVDEDGTYLAVDSLAVTVNNVQPMLAGTQNLTVNEGHSFTLAGLGVGISDPGFDKAGGVETFDVMRIDWGDGHVFDNSDADLTDQVSIVNRLSPDGGPTTAGFSHPAHTYADGGPGGSDYTVTMTVKDDDGDWVEREFIIHVTNERPTLVLTSELFERNEGQTLVVVDLGSFSDPGFNNPLNAGNLTNGGEFEETFSYTIDWGDGSPLETGKVPVTVNDGSPDMPTSGFLTSAALPVSHLYADNDADNTYTITVALSDDDGATHVQSFDINVWNVNPTLQPVTATDVETTGRTTLNLTFADPGADSFQVLVDWGDQLHLPPDQRFVVETVHPGPSTPGAPVSMTLEHFYAGPPDPLHPTNDIIITVQIHDDDALVAGVVAPGISNLQSAAISNPGIETINVSIDTTPEVPRLEFVAPTPPQVLLNQQSSSVQSLQTPDVRVAAGDLAATSERYLVLVVMSPEGEQVETHRLKDEALLDLRGLFATLPENHYKIFLVRTETDSWRLVIDVYVRRYFDRTLREWRGRVVDLSDDSEGTRDRPPTSEEIIETEAVPLEENPMLDPMPKAGETAPEPQAARGVSDVDGGDATEVYVPAANELRWALPLAALAWQSPSGSWSQCVDAAMRQADERAWQRLRRAGRLGRRSLQNMPSTKALK